MDDKRIRATVVTLAIAAVVLSAFSAVTVLSRPSAPPPAERTFVVLAVEYKGTFGAGESQPEGTVVKAYRWDPSYIQVNLGDTVNLNIYGVNGASHPSTIDAFGVSFTVYRGQWTNITFVASRAGLAEMVCHVAEHTETMHLWIDVLG